MFITHKQMLIKTMEYCVLTSTANKRKETTEIRLDNGSRKRKFSYNAAEEYVRQSLAI